MSLETEIQDLKELVIKNLGDLRKENEKLQTELKDGKNVNESRLKDLEQRCNKIDEDLALKEKKLIDKKKEDTFATAAKDLMAMITDINEKGIKGSITLFGDEKSMNPLNKKTLSTDIDPNGGYWLNPTFSNRIREFVVETSPVRRLATIENVPAGTTEHIVPVELEDATGAGWVEERGTRSVTATPKQGIVRIPLNEVYADPQTTQQVLLNPSFNTEAWLRRKVGAKLGRVENTAFVTGSGVGQPQGFLTDTRIGGITSSVSGGLNFDDLIELQTELKDEYNANADWAMKRTTVRLVRLIKDGNGRYIWEPSGQRGVPGLLLNDPVTLMEDMPAVAANAKSIIRGDFRELYTIADAGGLRLIIDPYTNKGFIEFYWSRYTGGAVVQPDAAKILTILA